ncbi:MAG: DUF1501 domain-containing protein [Actinobacteria bacterium]|nr:DUF1501 domain-containing protein [Actinomycetota bacterium]NBP22685.1 DUF1501 domain-containing protein [Actinomycetota bacterium]NBQ67076.1 DUF1501 domain-containing protein [Actinomycetota bacterium]NCU82716.1 DUF1501 domain-containing protein [Actinomycetota bacterium]NCV16482.1 DUF1501 domain-containing protein [Actinomycetota bacterium]
MDTITRRQFLKATGAGALGAAAMSLSIEEIANAAITRPLPLGTPILVVVTLYGGNDGLNTVVPVNDPIYQSLRPGIAYKPEDVLPLGENLYLNGSMSGMHSLWNKNQVAIVRGVGYPNSDRSHFSSMAIWQSALLGAAKTGWLGRWVESQPEDPFLAIGLGSVLPPLLAGSKRSGSVLPLGGLNVPSGSLASDCIKLAIESRSDNLLQAMAARTMRNLFTVSSDITPILKSPAPAAPDLPTANGGNAGGETNLSQQLDIVAKLVSAGAPTRVWSVSLGGFDTHADEKGAQAILLGVVSQALSKFMSQMRATNRSRDVVVLVYSEFGRRVRGNASDGTDHGTSGPVFVLGERVKGGFYGEQPSLNNLKNDDLAVTTDFRDIYASILEKVLATPAERILGNWKGRTPLFN